MENQGTDPSIQQTLPDQGSGNTTKQQNHYAIGWNFGHFTVNIDVITIAIP